MLQWDSEHRMIVNFIARRPGLTRTKAKKKCLYGVSKLKRKEKYQQFYFKL